MTLSPRATSRDTELTARFAAIGLQFRRVSHYKYSGNLTRYTVYYTHPGITNPRQGFDYNHSTEKYGETIEAFSISYDGLAEMDEYTANPDFLRMDTWRIAYNSLWKSRDLDTLQSHYNSAVRRYGEISAIVACHKIKTANNLPVNPNDAWNDSISRSTALMELTETLLAYENNNVAIFDQIGQRPVFDHKDGQPGGYRYYRSANRTY